MPRMIVCVPTATALVVGCLAMPTPGAPTSVELELQLSGGSGNGSAVFENLEHCQ